jgi:IMP dehydrogenase
MSNCFREPSRTFNEYLLVPGYSGKECNPENVDLKAAVTNIKREKTQKFK